MSTTVMFIGLTVFVAHFLALVFRRTQVPDVLVLVLAGIVLGPVTGLVTPADFGKVGPIIATIALVVILFESGTALDVDTLQRSLGTTGALTIGSFVLTAAVVTATGIAAFGLEPLPALMLGVTLGGTASAVVIPMVATLRLAVKPATVLVLESALTDVLCIVGVFALLQWAAEGQLDAGRVAGAVLAALVFAVVIGIAGGIGWLFVLGRVRGFPNTISSTLAYVFIVYGLTEYVGFSGAIAALSLGVTLGNVHRFGLERIAGRGTRIEALSAEDLNFFREAVFLLKTYFFVYLGISIRFADADVALVVVAMIVVVFVLRTLLVRVVFRAPEFGLRDAAVASMMAPKGLAAAVLATLPLEQGVPGGETIRDVAYLAVLISIALTALLVVVLPWSPVTRLYGAVLGKPVPSGPAPGAGPAQGDDGAR
ncbi:cation:proton antiporter [Calidifontimicrobium sp. SYSU G02091]|uniref:cation:proton antiporter domain-containing protein n=1 Tax=Calidifontimicrobium sp. SYSU G02091 TaxID=2926421 RepID=UPI001F52FEF7|nr:cation:proton antiporter [Calidifontimicrobium sp. SYSU G02091]MCI1190546.1 cation:proton antiporter [Calidifontimicrobium sp. SYSU G02091]